MDYREVLKADTVLDRKYRIDRVIGAGGFGITYQAFDLGLAAPVAVKEYYPAQFGMRDSTLSVRPRTDGDRPLFDRLRSSFLREARTLAQFDHPAIVRVISVFETHGTAYMVMRFESGPSLKAWLQGLDRAPRQSELDRLLWPLLDAIDLMHRSDFLHRDIAPDNIIVRADGTPVLLDFGASRRVVSHMSGTLTGVVKQGYSPQEQYSSDNRSQGPWTDIYSLGATLYLAVTGKVPTEATARMLEDGMMPALDGARGGYRPEFLSAIDAAMRLHPRNRPQSVPEWREMLFQGAEPGWYPEGGDGFLESSTGPDGIRTPVSSPRTGPHAGRSEPRSSPRQSAPRVQSAPRYVSEPRDAQGSAPRSAPSRSDFDPDVAAVSTPSGATGGAAAASLASRAADLALSTRGAAVLGVGAMLLGASMLFAFDSNVGARRAPISELAAVPAVVPDRSGDRSTADAGRLEFERQAEIARQREVARQAEAARQQQEEAARRTAEEARQREAARLAEAARQQQQEEAARRTAEEARQREAARLAEAARQQQEEAARRTAEEARQREAARLAEVARQQQEEAARRTAEEARQREAARLAEVARQQQEEARRVAEEARQRVASAAEVAADEARRARETAEAQRARDAARAQSNNLVTPPRDSPARQVTLATATGEAGPVAGQLAMMQGLVLAGGTDGRLRLWNPATNDLAQFAAQHAGAVTAVAISPDERRVVSGSQQGDLRIWDARNGALLHTIAGNNSPVVAVHYRTSTRAVAVHASGAWSIVEPEAGQTLMSGGKSGIPGVTAAAFSGDGKVIFAGLGQGPGGFVIEGWIPADGNTTRDAVRLIGHAGAILAIAAAPEGDVLASASADGTVRLWNVASGSESGRLNPSGGAVRDLVFSATGALVAGAGADGTVDVWRVSDGERVATFAASDRALRAVVLSPDGTSLVAAGEDGVVRQWLLPASLVIPPPAARAPVAQPAAIALPKPRIQAPPREEKAEPRPQRVRRDPPPERQRERSRPSERRAPSGGGGGGGGGGTSVRVPAF